jgi:Tol biopolymer transport system component
VRCLAATILATFALTSCADPSSPIDEPPASPKAASGGPLFDHAASPGPWIVAFTNSSAVQFSAVDGSGFRYVPCGGDLTHNGAPRWWLHTEYTGGVHPNGAERRELAAYDEDCNLGFVLTDVPGLVRDPFPVWSRDGRRVAYRGVNIDASGNRSNEGIWVGDVVCEAPGCGVGGRPIAIVNERLAVARFEPLRPSWAPDSRRVVYFAKTFLTAANTSFQFDLFIGDMDTGVETRLTATPDRFEEAPDWSPVSDEIAFHVPLRKPTRHDVFRIEIGTGRVTQITNGQNTPNVENTYPSWSDDGSQIAFTGLSKSGAQKNIFRISATGAGKAVNLTNSSTETYGSPRWRR